MKEMPAAKNRANAKKLNFYPIGKRFNLLVFVLALSFVLSGCGKKIIVNNEARNNIPSSNVDKISSKQPVSLLFVGDLMFDRYIREVAVKRGNEFIFAGIKDLLADNNLVVANLEGPITDRASVSVNTQLDEKKNLVFTFDPALAPLLAQNNIGLVSLGNNHILNQGAEGVRQTEKFLEDARVEYFGDTGVDEGSTFVKEINGIKIAFVNYNYSVEGSFERVMGNIKSAKAQADIVIACPHWGTEYKTGDPGQAAKNMAHQFIDAGADLIIGTHPHVAQDSEVYNGKKIYYSLGNFIFDQYFQKETMQGLGVKITVDPDGTMEYSELNFEMTKRGQTVLKAEH